MKVWLLLVACVTAFMVNAVYGEECDLHWDCAQGGVCAFGACYYGDIPNYHCGKIGCPSGEVCRDEAGILGSCTGNEQVCGAHFDCAQGEYCYYGECLRDAEMTIYHCDKPGCVPGRWCVNQESEKESCDEDISYACRSACDCGPAHACIDIPGFGQRCVKDVHDPWLPDGEVPFPDPVEIAAEEPTYCSSDPECHAGLTASENSPNVIKPFWAYNPVSGKPVQYCGTTPCYFTGDCKGGQSCVDTRKYAKCGNGICELGEPGEAGDPGVCSLDCSCKDDSCLDPIRRDPAGTLCNRLGGLCVSNAIAESVFGWSSSELVPACEKSMLPASKCETGWTSGGAYAVQRLVQKFPLRGGVAECGNGACEVGESAENCVQDCWCGDNICDASEVGVCIADCNSCGSEDSCEDCAAYTNPSYFCGDDICQSGGYTPEDCLYNEESEKFIVPCTQDCPGLGDSDNDGIPGGCDLCPQDPCKSEPGNMGCGATEDGSDYDTDGDGIPNCVDRNDDNDGIPDDEDNCPLIENFDQADADQDGLGDVCDPTPNGELVAGDLNGDGVADDADYQILRTALGSCEGDARFNPDADYTGDGCVDYSDLREWQIIADSPAPPVTQPSGC